MGIITGAALVVIGAVVGACLMGLVHRQAEKFEIKNMAEVLKQFPSNEPYNFEAITKALSGLSDRAQATFIFLYIQSLQKNKRMLATISRCLTYVEGPIKAKDKGPALSRPTKQTN